MKTLIAAENISLDSPVAKRFGHAPCYLLVDTDTMQFEVIDNTQTHDETHDIIPQMAARGVETLVTGNIGPHAFRLTQSLNLKVALARALPVSKALEKLQRNELKILTEPTMKHSIHDHHDH